MEAELDIEAMLEEDDLGRTEVKDINQNTKEEEKSMMCAEITAAGKPLKITARPLPETPDEGVLLKTLYAGMCHSDVHFIDDNQDLGDGKVFKYRDILGEKFSGIIPGHEICGVVEELGKQVESHHPIKVGDTVLVYPFMGCRQCEACTTKQSNLCENNSAGVTDIGQGENSGGYGSYIPVPDIGLCIKLPKNLKPEIGCMLPCGALTAYSALQKARPTLEAAVRIRGVANLLVIGSGGLGMWTIIIVKHVFCDKNIKIICVDIHKEKLDTAAKLGADDIVKWDDESDKETLVATTTVNGYNKIDAAINYVGSQRTVDISFNCLHYGGTMIMVGLHGGEYKLSLPVLIASSISIQGLRTGGISNLRQLVDILAVQDIQTYPPLEIISLDQVNDTIERLRRGEVQGRAIIKYTD